MGSSKWINLYNFPIFQPWTIGLGIFHETKITVDGDNFNNGNHVFLEEKYPYFSCKSNCQQFSSCNLVEVANKHKHTFVPFLWKKWGGVDVEVVQCSFKLTVLRTFQFYYMQIWRLVYYGLQPVWPGLSAKYVLFGRKTMFTEVYRTIINVHLTAGVKVAPGPHYRIFVNARG